MCFGYMCIATCNKLIIAKQNTNASNLQLNKTLTKRSIFLLIFKSHRKKHG